MSDFYVGYLPKAPAVLARFVKTVVVGLGLLAAALALTLVLAQMPFANSAFEFGTLRTFEGTVQAHPYPMLVVERPGADGAQKYSSYLLVAPGKHGADGLVANFDGKSVKLQGQLIYRAGGTMVEVTPGSISVQNSSPVAALAVRDLGLVTLTGEIVDSKCYLGVMNPGRGKVHRDCAARCLSGGIPPIFISSTGADAGEQFLLVDAKGAALGSDVLREFVAEPISVRGKLLQRGSTRLLAIDPANLRHAPDRIQVR